MALLPWGVHVVETLVQTIVGTRGEVAAKIQLLAPGAVGATKQVLLDCLNQPISNSLIEYTAKEYLRVRRGKECEEGMEAYRSKQKPPWVQKAIDVKEDET